MNRGHEPVEWASMRRVAVRREPPTERSALLERLRALADRSFSKPDGAGEYRVADVATITQIMTRTRQFVRTEAFPRPHLVAVLFGTKSVNVDKADLCVEVGDVLVMPANVKFELTNIPDGAAGFYRAICIEVVAQVSASLQSKHPHLSGRWGLGAFESDRPFVTTMTDSTLQSLCHFSAGVFLADAHPAILRHRLEELMLSLTLQAANPSTVDDDIVIAVRRSVRTSIDGEVRLERIAKTLGMSVATLRRRLAEHGTQLRDLLRSERMALGRALLLEGRLNVAEVAAKCGYSSPSKFARQFIATIGESPADFRKRHSGPAHSP